MIAAVEMLKIDDNANEISLIYISNVMFADLFLLKQKLSEFYLGNTKEYQLEFDLMYLPIVNQIFDEIIFKHGFRMTFFRYPTSCDFKVYQSFAKQSGFKR